ncbi:MAG TPA: hypothetical protein VLB50_02350 [Ignavibacteriaceae bacterium]|nr:hypothetical protein [Ignavibacteriaceae bacterium]
MSIREIKWTDKEKKVARKAFDLAYEREMEEIKTLLTEKVSDLKTESDVWAIEDFLYDRRKNVDAKYDYRYSKLILVFGRLLSEGYLKETDILELNEDKRELIKKISMFE